MRGPALVVGINPAMPVEQRHGSVWFQVSGFGTVRRDFLVDDLERLAHHPKRLSRVVAKQIMLIDQTLPKREELCQPIKIDILSEHVRLIYDMLNYSLVLKQRR